MDPEWILVVNLRPLKLLTPTCFSAIFKLFWFTPHVIDRVTISKEGCTPPSLAENLAAFEVFSFLMTISKFTKIASEASNRFSDETFLTVFQTVCSRPKSVTRMNFLELFWQAAKMLFKTLLFCFLKLQGFFPLAVLLLFLFVFGMVFKVYSTQKLLCRGLCRQNGSFVTCFQLSPDDHAFGK